MTVPPGSELVVTLKAGTMVIDSAFVLVPPNVSVTRTEKFAVPVAPGVPEKTPAVESERLPGRDPEATVQVFAPIPPLEANAGAE